MIELVGALTGLCVAGLGAGYLAPQALRTGSDERLRQVIAKQRLLALTYDDGPSQFTPLILERLKSAEAKATFFLLGSQAQRIPEMAERIHAEGHEVASHAQEHINSWRVLPWVGSRNVRRGHDSLTRWMSKDGFFRPPYGRLSLAAWWAARRTHMKVCWWTLDGKDTAPQLPPIQTVIEAMIAQHGGVVLLHDFERKDQSRLKFMLDLTDELLRAAKREGIRPCTVSELFTNVG